MSNIIKSPYTKKIDPMPITIQLRRQTKTNELTNELDERIVQQSNIEASRIIEEATKQQNQVIEQIEKEKARWEEERKQLVEEARKEGFNQGFKQGKQEVNKQYDELMGQARNIVSLSKKEYEKKLESAKEEMVSLSIQIAEKVMGMNLDLKPSLLTSLVKKVLKDVKDHPEVKIYVNPECFPLLMDAKEELKKTLINQADLFIYPDEQMNKDGCMIESKYGLIDASIDTQLEQLKKQLVEIVKEGSSSC
ncbi:flagellar assembly protein FliH [Bacillus carboniphilus]|uniref:Flagellar assembly protein FliH n=1 Tax=Bacillus carboniphilus TaxID=86663 RepID=A0ABY9JVW5_9BACI|nr:flagellar assembly protein FliH [Bacillus carboniphilus]WLR43542.1 flagellar assembly protein FliH [Bacillus carboniphilus]